jgi:hypothetical protein
MSMPGILGHNKTIIRVSRSRYCQLLPPPRMTKSAYGEVRPSIRSQLDRLTTSPERYCRGICRPGSALNAAKTSPRILRDRAARACGTAQNAALACCRLCRHQYATGGSGLADRSQTQVRPCLTPLLTWGNVWQVLGSNQRRLSRRFYRAYAQYP